MGIRKVWLVNKYAMPPQYESRLRTIKFAHYLQEKGYDVTIFGCSIMHNLNMDLIEDGSLYIERQFLEVRPQGKLPNPTKKKRKRNGWPNNRSGTSGGLRPRKSFDTSFWD